MATVFTIFVGFASGHDSSQDVVLENKRTLHRVLKNLAPFGFTLIEGSGFYQGKEEPSATVILVATTSSEAQLLGDLSAKIAQEYKSLASQDVVWITKREESLLAV